MHRCTTVGPPDRRHALQRHDYSENNPLNGTDSTGLLTYIAGGGFSAVAPSGGAEGSAGVAYYNPTTAQTGWFMATTRSPISPPSPASPVPEMPPRRRCPTSR